MRLRTGLLSALVAAALLGPLAAPRPAQAYWGGGWHGGGGGGGWHGGGWGGGWHGGWGGWHGGWGGWHGG
ncbi:MAG TPA: hypothetical protein VJY39_16755, partial [Acidisphaera sp.]|nr:hypothetical protein [Acidisphaera sp.]